jgi:transposase
MASMDEKLGALPRTVAELQELMARMAQDHESKLYKLSVELDEERAQRIEQQNLALKYFEQLQLLRRRAFGRSAEKLGEEDRRQLTLFNEAEAIVVARRAEEPRVEVRGHTRAKRGRKPLPPDLPRVETVHDIPEDQKHCACGKALVRIGEEVCEKLEVIPARIRVRRHVRPKYACKACEGSGDEEHAAVRIAPKVRQLLPKSIASPALVAYIVVGKFCDGLPLYRQEKQFARIGVELSRQDMANWVLGVFRRLRPLRELFRRAIRGGPKVGIDETTVQVMDEPDRPNTTKSYMWVFLGGEAGRPVVEFQYHPTRSGKVPLEALKGYQGFIQTDGYEGYTELGRQPGVVHVGCWAHARRKLYEAIQVSKNGSCATEAMAHIDSLFRLERSLRQQTLSPEAFMKARGQQAEPIMKSLRSWLQEQEPRVPPSLTLGKAIAYTVGQWPKLVRYLESPLLGPDNNACEQAIRPFVVGRKNWLLAGSPTGAEASAAWYSFIETAKLNGMEPYLYLCYILSRIPDSDDPEAYRPLLPWNVPKGSLLDFESGHLV